MATDIRFWIQFSWAAIFLGGSWILYGHGVFASLGFSGFLTPSSGGLRLAFTLFRTAAETLFLAGVGWAIHSSFWRSKGLSLPEFLLLAWAPLCGAWISLQRTVFALPGTDLLSVIEPAMVSIGIPLLIGATGALVLEGVDQISPDERRTAPGLNRILRAQVVGAPVLALLLYLMALAGFWRPTHLWLASVVLAAAAAGVALYRSRPHATDSDVLSVREFAHSKHWVKTLQNPRVYLWGTLFLLLFGMFQLCWLPPDDSDELRYHLTFPKRYLEAGGFVVLPDQLFSYFPTGMELLMGVPLSLDWLRPEESRWGLVSGGKFVHAWFAWLCVLVLMVWFREIGEDDRNERERDPIDSVPPILFLSIPFVPILASWAFVDFGSAFGWLASAYYGWRWFFRTEKGAEQTRLLCLIGAALGWSLMVKYTGLAWCVLFGVVWIAHAVLLRRRLSSLIPIVVVTTLLFAPWLLNNAARTGNPLAPMLSGVFDFGFDPAQKAFYDWHAGMKGDLNGFRDLGLVDKAVDLIALPFHAALHPERFENNPIGGLIPILLPCFFFGLWRRGKGNGGPWAALLALGCFLLWGLTYRDPRFAIPLWGVYLLVASLGVRGLIVADQSPWRGWAGWGFLVVFIALAVSQSEEVFRRLGGFGPVLRLEIDRDDYLSRRLPAMRTTREVERLRREAPTRPNLLLLGQEQSYYFDSPVRGADYFDGPLLARLAREATGVADISERLKADGVEWIFLNRDTLELHPANRVRGWWFVQPTAEGAAAIEAVSRSGDLGRGFELADRSPAFRRMHAWMIRHPGFKEVPLQSAPKRDRALADLYHPWLSWPELEGIKVSDLPTTGYSLLASERGGAGSNLSPR